MMRSMYSGVSGLRIHQTKMDVIGNNISNVNTAGFKAGRVTFNEIFSQTLQGASAASDKLGGRNPMQVGLGANIASIDTLMTEGAAQRTDNPLDMKIEGDGFFVLHGPGGYRFSRAGAFRIDNAGNLANPEGLNVMGWPVDSTTGNINKGEVSKIQIMKPENLYSEPSKTSAATVFGNLNKNDSNISHLKDGVLVTFDIYDSQGYRYTVNARIKENAPGGTVTPDEYVLTIDNNHGIQDSDGNSITSTLNPASVVITFDNNGKVDTTALSTFDITNIDGGSAKFSNVSVDVTQLTLFDKETTATGKAGDINGLNAGNKVGALSGFNIGPDGIINGSYTNGESKILGQVVVAKFQNPAGLQKVGNNLFQVTTNSGEFDGIGTDPQSDGGALNGGVLEMSNVDLSREFTEMITTQRGFQANSRIITSSDEMLQELVNLKR
ncbi:flagellar hook protein FlgE [Vallitalea pronyensis]|uniref:Flagellar hook protein FlgE n=1 Tax=Vallitalea pronyensis TaxID=1348613 RepID=A0A8J8SHB2_9FIRM|nr:flagellar hook protein FlgE [Vallitalea pronyensis]QUI23232.1 flagellar hook protein FlgE [Vallitalea pronyensis]